MSNCLPFIFDKLSSVSHYAPPVATWQYTGPIDGSEKPKHHFLNH